MLDFLLNHSWKISDGDMIASSKSMAGNSYRREYISTTSAHQIYAMAIYPHLMTENTKL